MGIAGSKKITAKEESVSKDHRRSDNVLDQLMTTELKKWCPRM